jgi:hypothetical protein
MSHNKNWDAVKKDAGHIFKENLRVYILALIGMFVSAGGFHQLYAYFTSDWKEVVQIIAITRNALLVCLGAIALALGFFWVRQKAPVIYGSFEIGAAGITTFDICLKSGNLDGPHWLLAFLGSLYIAVRGIDNINKEINFISTSEKESSLNSIQRIQIKE